MPWDRCPYCGRPECGHTKRCTICGDFVMEVGGHDGPRGLYIERYWRHLRRWHKRGEA